MNVVIIVSKCVITKECFAIRMEEYTNNHWYATWAFAISENRAKREKYDSIAIKGGFFSDPEKYPGCPYCKSGGYYRCSCGKINCWHEERQTVTCAWCNQTSKIAGTISELSTSGDI